MSTWKIRVRRWDAKVHRHRETVHPSTAFVLCAQSDHQFCRHRAGEVILRTHTVKTIEVYEALKEIIIYTSETVYAEPRPRP